MKNIRSPKKQAYTIPDKIHAEEADYLYIETSQIPNAGNGLYTAIRIYSNEVISIFKGDLLSNAEAATRAELGTDGYFVVMPDGTIMDSMHVEGFAKYANDSEGFVKTGFKLNATITLDEDENVCLVANRNIKIGEEIFCAYGPKYWEKHTKHLPINTEISKN